MLVIWGFILVEQSLYSLVLLNFLQLSGWPQRGRLLPRFNLYIL
jgi:hypothetical protein